MVYRRRRQGKRPFRKPRAKKPGLRGVRKEIALLKKRMEVATEKTQYQVTESIDVTSPFTARNLCNYNSWVQMFPTTAHGTDKHEMYHRYLIIDNHISLENPLGPDERSNTNFTYFIISRKKAFATATDTGNTLAMTNAIDYANNAGLTYMNLHRWNVHYVKRFSLTQAENTAGDSSVIMKRFQARVKVNRKVVNTDGPWSVLQNSGDSTDTFYAVLFNDNSTLDLESPRWTFQCLHSVEH